MAEEAFILRVPAALADRFRAVLRESDDARPGDADVSLAFTPDGSTGTLTVGGECYPAAAQMLPTVVEAWKTYDDVNLIKALDVAQIITVREPGAAAPVADEARDGLTPAMRDVRRRQFRKAPILDPADVARAEQRLVRVLTGAPGRTVAVHMTEEYVNIDEADPPPGPLHDDESLDAPEKSERGGGPEASGRPEASAGGYDSAPAPRRLVKFKNIMGGGAGAADPGPAADVSMLIDD